MTSVQTLLVLILIPVGIYCLITVLTLWPKFARSRYRADQEWDFPPALWVANPERVGTSASAVQLPDDPTQQARPTTARGGARGNW